ncbi:MAG: YbhB/YbcL family Raf kinase inhibitor-like protein [Candidatus Methanoplasma sp.]|jgi:Raf kinase inhibitor-like YbhB/YbcL family protein|nr:YbhB/YbcL family Raf kinase inhibitor-like protein [Candidatus Methanoplasma sp.]
MKVESKGITGGKIADRFGSKGSQFTPGGMPSYSLPISIIDPPSDAVSFALVMVDYDAVPVCGFTWIHWLVADMRRLSLDENESVSAKDIKQGVNSFHSCASPLSSEEAVGYGGPDPPDREHEYVLEVFALDKELGLENGFMLNDLVKAMDGNILAYANIKGKYPQR